MATFAYDGRSEVGRPVQGSVEAESKRAAASQLRLGGITPLRIVRTEEGKQDEGGSRPRFGERGVRTSDLMVLMRQLYSLTRAGVPILRAMNGLSQSTRSPVLARVLQELSESLSSGLGLAASMQRHPAVFPPLVVGLVRVGEDSGRLEESFLQITDYLDRDQQTRKHIQSATRYPTFVTIAIGVALVVINLLVIPAFAKAYERLDAQLPWATRVLMATSHFMLDYWPHLAVGAVLGVLGVRAALRQPGIRVRWHRAKLRMPIFGNIIERALVARFSRSFAVTLRSGVSLTQALSLVSGVVDNDHVRERVLGMRRSIERGETLVRAAAASGVFTPLALQMFAVGEESGAVEDLCQEVAEYYEREVDYDVKRLGDLIEPILIGGIGAVVLVLALGVYLPMWDLATAMKGG